MGRYAVVLGAAFVGAWCAIAATVLIVVGPLQWWRILTRSAAHGHLRFVLVGVLVVVLPLLLLATLLRFRRNWIPYVSVVAIAAVTPALIVPRLAHLIPPVGWIALIAVEILGMLSAYAVTQRAIGQSSTAR
ncbi:hypothetical protein [Cumulibacter soli]|uniref:hypothetical protein n=1 Tax=Cumulibacter soli TaxID=2546344 RepID=UPI0010680BDC|nr:hypothetical protein [Cumulibacter soli]